ncbi:hypothetical protein OLL89_04570 [Enterococcus faecalis]|nr:hypothetical protein OLL89_04570 [Enterococcus faecalis]
MTMSEFELRMIAFNLAEVDEERKRHELAYLNVKAQATNKKGKPVFESFKSFYDYEKRVAEVLAANQPQRTKLNERKKNATCHCGRASTPLSRREESRWRMTKKKRRYRRQRKALQASNKH